MAEISVQVELTEREANAAKAISWLKEVYGLEPGHGKKLKLQEWVKQHVPKYKWYRWNTLLAGVIDRLVEGDLHTVFVFCPPRHGKSEFVSRILPAYFLYRFPERWAALSSYNAMLAATFSRASRARFNLPLSEESQSAMSWETQLGGGMWAAGVGGTQTGRGWHLGICDDPVKDAEEASSVVMQERNRDWWDSVWMTRAEPGAKKLLTMTRWHSNDVAGHVLRSQKDWTGAAVVHLPALAEDRKHVLELYENYPNIEVVPDWREIGEPLCPERFPLDALKDIQARLVDYYWACLYQQRPSVRGGSMFPKVNAKIIPALDQSQVRVRVRYWDKAGTAGGGAYTAGVKMAVMRDDSYVVEDVVRGQWSALDREQAMKNTAQQDGRYCHIRVEQEPGSGGKDSAEASIRNLSGYKVAADRPTGDKTTRAEPIAAQWQGNNVSLIEGAWNREYLAELETFPTGTYRDQVDATSGAAKTLLELNQKRKMVPPAGGPRHPVYSV
jgi:predicted phage terminase large subunit-like protein